MLHFKNEPADKRCRIEGISPEIVLALTIISSIYQTYQTYPVITSVTDGKHGKNSLHPMGKAVDLRLPPAYLTAIFNKIAEALGPDFDVVLEATHIHVEFDPKG
jgi:hypothetical protein